MIGLRFDTFTTAVIGFALNEAAFSGEIIRGGIISVDRNQSIAAKSLGMGPTLTLRRIIMPQALRPILPAMTNDTISMLKLTSIASVIFVNELTFRAQQIVEQNFKFFTVFAAAAVIYLVMTSVISIVQAILERRFSLEKQPLPVSATAMGRFFGFRGMEKPVAAPASYAPASPPPPDPDAVPERVADTSDWIELLAEQQRETREHKDEPFVVCTDVHKSYGPNHVLRGIDMTVKRGEVVTIMGPSGSGKSTLLRMVNHLEAIDDGEITVDGKYVGYEVVKGKLKPSRDLSRARAEARIGMVFQHFNLFHHFSALENVVEAPIRVYGVRKQQAHEAARRLLIGVGLGGHLDPPAAPAFRRPAAARGDLARARHLAQADAVRRADFGPRSRAGFRSALRDPSPRRGGHDAHRGHPRGPLRQGGGGPGDLHGRRTDRRGGAARSGPRQPEGGAHPALPAARGARGRHVLTKET